MTNIEQYIENQGPCLSGELELYIVNADNIKEEAARKRIQRLKSPIHKISGFFSERQSFLYHSDIFNTPEFYEGLKDSFARAGRRYNAVITAINYHDVTSSRIIGPV